MYDPYNYISFVELNKRRRGDFERGPSARIENRTHQQKPAVKRIYLKRNGDSVHGKGKLYVWRQHQAPTIHELIEAAGDYVGEPDAYNLYDGNGHRITHEEDVHENGTYYVASDEGFYATTIPVPEEHEFPKEYLQPPGSAPRSMVSAWLRQSQTPLRTAFSHSDLPGNPYSDATLYNPNSQSHPELFPARSYYSLSRNGSRANIESRRASQAAQEEPQEFEDQLVDVQAEEEPEAVEAKDQQPEAAEEMPERPDFLVYTSAHSTTGIRRPLKKVEPESLQKKPKKKVKKKKARAENESKDELDEYEAAYREALNAQLPQNDPSTSRVANPYDYYENDGGRSAKTRGRDNHQSATRYRSALTRGRDDDHKYDEYDGRFQQHSAPADYRREKSSGKPRTRRARSTNSANPNLEDSMVSDFHDDEAALKDKLMLEKHKQKHLGYSRSHSAQIFNRRDQTNPSAYIIYVFLNGNGMDCQYVDFSKSQLEKGMPYVLELCARKYRVNPARLVNMDGKKIGEVNDMMSRGAYVLIPVGQSFRDTWYFLPDNAIDTSSDTEKVRARSAQRDRYIQKREREERRKTSHKRSKSSGYYQR